MTSVIPTSLLMGSTGMFSPTQRRKAGVPRFATHGKNWRNRLILLRVGLYEDERDKVTSAVSGGDARIMARSFTRESS